MSIQTCCSTETRTFGVFAHSFYTDDQVRLHCLQNSLLATSNFKYLSVFQQQSWLTWHWHSLASFPWFLSSIDANTSGHLLWVCECVYKNYIWGSVEQRSNSGQWPSISRRLYICISTIGNLHSLLNISNSSSNLCSSKFISVFTPKAQCIHWLFFILVRHSWWLEHNVMIVMLSCTSCIYVLMSRSQSDFHISSSQVSSSPLFFSLSVSEV